jgi:hypothetical protein
MPILPNRTRTARIFGVDPPGDGQWRHPKLILGRDVADD